jgi:hypothetical protein
MRDLFSRQISYIKRVTTDLPGLLHRDNYIVTGQFLLIYLDLQEYHNRYTN